MEKIDFKNLSEKDKGYIKTVHANNDLSWDQRMSMLINKFGVSERTIRRWIKKLGFSDKSYIENEEIREAQRRTYDKKKYYLFTWAQNATPIHPGFWNNLKAYSEYLNADIGVIAGRYQNPTSIWTENMEKDEWWDPEVKPYLDASRTRLHNYLDILADVKIVPTAHNPLSGFEGVSGESSLIIGHPRVHFQVLPALEGHNKKMMFTTGACTLKNYTETKAGKKGEFHHTYGFVIVEVKDDLIFYIRQVTANSTGDFTDLIYNVASGVVSEIDSCEAYITGDIHASQCEFPIMDKTVELFDIIKPKNVVIHDTFNGKSISHHDKRDPVKLYQKYSDGLDILKDELDITFDLIDRYSLTNYNLIVVRSNHDEWIDRWLRNYDWRDDIKNAKEYAEFLHVTLSGKAPKGIFPYLLNQRYGDKVTTLGYDESYKISGWEVGQHGHMGANGAKSSMTSFRKLNTKLIVGDSHCLPLEYQVQFKDRGWGELRTVRKGDIILSYDPLTKTNEWVEVDEYIEFDYSGVMLKIEGNGFEQTFTDQHMLMLEDGSYIPATQAICTRSASELPLSAKAVDSGISVPINTIRQIVAIAADGSVDMNTFNIANPKYGRIRFGLKKERKIQRLYTLFDNDIKKYESKQEGFDGYIATNSESVLKILEYKPNLLRNKRISTEVLSWDKESLEVLQDELSYWDGSFDMDSNGRQWSTTSKKEANIISSVLTRLGYSSRLNKRKNNDGTIYTLTWCVDRSFKRSTEKAAHHARFNSWGFSSYNTQSVKVGCVRVKNHCFWIKSDKTGQVSLTGNSPERKDGVLQVGTYSVLRMGFNEGPSSWMHCGAIIHNDKKAQLIIFAEDYNFTTFKLKKK